MRFNTTIVMDALTHGRAREMKTKLAFVVVALALALVAPSQAAELRTTLDATQWSHTPDDAIELTFAMTNTTSDTLYVLRYLTPVDGIQGDILQVLRDGKPVAYTGMVVKRAEPVAEDFVAIPAGETLTVTFDPSSAYDMSVTGEYAISYRAQWAEAKATSEPVSVWVEGWQTAAEAEAFSAFLDKGKPPGGGGGGVFTGCTTTQQNKLTTARTDALQMLTLAVSHLAANPNGSSLYAWWFGAYSSARFNTVTSHFNALKSTFTSNPITYDCSTCKMNAYAYVYPSQPYKVYLCRVFWNAPATGRDSKAGTLIHEVSHFNVVAGTDDYVYGATGAHNLALTNPGQAVDNADNHEYFSEDQ